VKRIILALVTVCGLAFSDTFEERIEQLKQSLPAVLKAQKDKLPISYKTKFKFKGSESKKIPMPDNANYLYKEIDIPKGFEVSETLNGTLILSRAVRILSSIEVKEKLMQKKARESYEKGSGSIKPQCALAWDIGERLGIEGSWTGTAKNKFSVKNMLPTDISSEGIAFDNVTFKLKIKY